MEGAIALGFGVTIGFTGFAGVAVMEISASMISTLVGTIDLIIRSRMFLTSHNWYWI